MTLQKQYTRNYETHQAVSHIFERDFHFIEFNILCGELEHARRDFKTFLINFDRFIHSIADLKIKAEYGDVTREILLPLVQAYNEQLQAKRGVFPREKVTTAENKNESKTVHLQTSDHTPANVRPVVHFNNHHNTLTLSPLTHTDKETHKASEASGRATSFNAISPHNSPANATPKKGVARLQSPANGNRTFADRAQPTPYTQARDTPHHAPFNKLTESFLNAQPDPFRHQWKDVRDSGKFILASMEAHRL
ncbi:hypothetical protein G3A39_43880, partial [Paraburkholderia aspalathi]|nr:hypothetical protein [Paraburkholderia aspalathi]